MRVTPALVKLRRKSTFSTSCSLRSSRSVTCSTVSSSVAPGQFAWTTIVRKVNGGSSLRPSVEYETAPATMDAIITKMMNDLWLSAQEERLTPITKLR